MKSRLRWAWGGKRTPFWKSGTFWTAAATVTIAVFTYFLVHYSGGQLDAMRGQLKNAVTQTALDQRPWVFINRCRLSDEPRKDNFIVITCSLFNSGKTPAMEILNESHAYISDAEPPFTEFKFARIPSKMVLPPGTLGIRNYSFSVKHVFPNEFIHAYRMQGLKMYFHARIRYCDIYKHLHWTDICVFRAYGDALDNWQFCVNGNGVDQEDQPCPNPN